MGGKSSKSPSMQRTGSNVSTFALDSQEPLFQPNFGGITAGTLLPLPHQRKKLPPEPKPPPPPPLRRKENMKKKSTKTSATSLEVPKTRAPLPPSPPPPERRESLAIISGKSSTFTSSEDPGYMQRKNSSLSTTSLPAANSHRHSKHSHDPSHQCAHEHKKTLLIAEFTFVADGETEMSLEEGDQLYLLDNCADDWWYVESKVSQRRGFVPKSHIRQADIREAWFSGNISRIEAERRVLQPNLPVGAFLVREKPNEKYFVLTVKDSSGNARHYEVQQLPNDKGFTMGDDLRFFSLPDLIEHYRKQNGGLCTTLTAAAPPIREDQERIYSTMVSWEVKRETIRLIENVGSGQFGEVFYAKWNNVEVAVKTLKDESVETSKEFLREASLLTKLDHVNLRPYYIITEYMKNGSLLDLLKLGLQKNKLSIPGAINIAAQVASGMAHLEDRGLIHRDLAARNVLVGEITDNVPFVKVADFGLARQLDPGDRIYSMSTNTFLPVKWMSPESFYDQIFSSKSDVWSYGIFLYELATEGATPYKDWTSEKAMREVDHGYRLPRPETVPEFVYSEVFLACVAKDPEKRPSFHRLFKFFDEYYAYSSLMNTKEVPHHLRTPISS